MNAAPDYLATFGLQQHPYLDADDMRFFYADPSLIQRLDLLQHLTQFGDMLLGVSGPVGSGKTTLAQQFLRRANSTWRICRLSGAHIQHPDELLVKLAECLGLHSTATPERLKTDLLRHCETLRHNAQLAVLVIDDAQQLPDPALKALLELADDPRETLKRLRVILFSEARLEQRLAATGWHSPQQPLLHHLDIPRFDEQQAAAYLMYRLAVAGYSGESPFSRTEIRALYKATDGLPGKLNVLAHETLVEHAGRIATRKNVAGPGARRGRPVMVLGLIGSLVAGALAWYLSQEQTTAPPRVPPAPPEATASKPTIVSPVPPAESTLESAPEPMTEPAREPGPAPEQEPEKSLETTPEIQQAPAITTEAPAEPLPPPTQSAGPTDAATDTKPAPLIEAAKPQPLPESAPTPATPPGAEANIPAPPPPSQPVAPVKSAPVPEATTTAPTPTNKPDLAEKAPPPPPAAAEVTPKPRQATAATATAEAEQLGAAWLQSRPGTHFTLQLLGGRKEKSLREYLKQHRVAEPIAIFRTVYKGAAWYVLVHGDFKNMAAAQQAVATLPLAVRKDKPWPRSFASIHDAIRK